jgi:hypothetical protein
VNFNREDINRLLADPQATVNDRVRCLLQDWLELFDRLPLKAQLELWPPSQTSIACPMCPGSKCTLCGGSGKTTQEKLQHWVLHGMPNPFEPK